MRISKRDWNKVYARHVNQMAQFPAERRCLRQKQVTFEQSRFHIGEHKSG